jgi:hypothetical protein
VGGPQKVEVPYGNSFPPLGRSVIWTHSDSEVLPSDSVVRFVC